MKSIFTFLTIFATTVAFAQIPSADFESWSTPAGQTYENPTGWGTSNDVGAQLGVALTNVTKETGAPISGATSVKMNTVSLGFVNVAGVALTGSISYGSGLSFSGGFPFTTRPGSLTGKMKYNAGATTDSSFIYAILFKWNTATLSRDTIGAGILITSTFATPVDFAMPINYVSGITANPDSALILFSSSKGFAGSAGSTLWIDDLQFDFVEGVNSLNNNIISSFPNPASDIINLNSVPGQFSVATIYDIYGREVSTVSVRGNQISVSNLNNGQYMMLLSNSKNEIYKSSVLINR